MIGLGNFGPGAWATIPTVHVPQPVNKTKPVSFVKAGVGRWDICYSANFKKPPVPKFRVSNQSDRMRHE